MKKARYTEEQIGFALRQAETGTAVAEICRKMGIGSDVLPLEEAYRRNGRSEIRRLKQLEEENRRLKQLVADLTLDKAMLQDVVRSKR